MSSGGAPAGGPGGGSLNSQPALSGSQPSQANLGITTNMSPVTSNEEPPTMAASSFSDELAHSSSASGTAGNVSISGKIINSPFNMPANHAHSSASSGFFGSATHSGYSSLSPAFDGSNNINPMTPASSTPTVPGGNHGKALGHQHATVAKDSIPARLKHQTEKKSPQPKLYRFPTHGPNLVRNTDHQHTPDEKAATSQSPMVAAMKRQSATAGITDKFGDTNAFKKPKLPGITTTTTSTSMKSQNFASQAAYHAAHLAAAHHAAHMAAQKPLSSTRGHLVDSPAHGCFLTVQDVQKLINDRIKELEARVEQNMPTVHEQAKPELVAILRQLSQEGFGQLRGELVAKIERMSWDSNERGKRDMTLFLQQQLRDLYAHVNRDLTNLDRSVQARHEDIKRDLMDIVERTCDDMQEQLTREVGATVSEICAESEDIVFECLQDQNRKHTNEMTRKISAKVQQVFETYYKRHLESLHPRVQGNAAGGGGGGARNTRADRCTNQQFLEFLCSANFHSDNMKNLKVLSSFLHSDRIREYVIVSETRDELKPTRPGSKGKAEDVAGAEVDGAGSVTRTLFFKVGGTTSPIYTFDPYAGTPFGGGSGSANAGLSSAQEEAIKKIIKTVPVVELMSLSTNYPGIPPITYPKYAAPIGPVFSRMVNHKEGTTHVTETSYHVFVGLTPEKPLWLMYRAADVSPEGEIVRFRPTSAGNLPKLRDCSPLPRFFNAYMIDLVAREWSDASKPMISMAKLTGARSSAIELPVLDPQLENCKKLCWAKPDMGTFVKEMADLWPVFYQPHQAQANQHGAGNYGDTEIEGASGQHGNHGALSF